MKKIIITLMAVIIAVSCVAMLVACNSNSEAALGHGVKAFRDKVLLSSKFPTEVAKKPGDFRKQLESTLKNLDTDYLDFYHFWGINKGSFDTQRKIPLFAV